MPKVDETLDPSASTEQPDTEQAVTTDVETSTEVTDPTTESTETVTETPAPRLYAGKYKTPEELEAAYQSSTSEASRMAQEISSLKTPKATKTEDPKHTPEQLESWKEARILDVSRNQAAAQRAYADGDYTKAQALEAQAVESARQIRLIDTELRKIDIQSASQGASRKTAEAKLVQEAVGVLHQYKDDLRPGTDLHTKASAFMEGYAAMGMDVESPLIQAQAVSMAAQILGLSSKKVAVATRKELTNTINQALKQGVTAGTGKAAKGAAPVDFLKMTDAEFKAYKAARGWD